MKHRKALVLAVSATFVFLALGCGPSASSAAKADAAIAPPAVPVADTVTPTSTALTPPTASPSRSATPLATSSATPSATPSPLPMKAAPDRRPVAVVVENELPARPQSGLGEADVIYEAVAEFNLTRFLAVFLDSNVDVVGPVRSGRAYHAAIAAEYDAALAHCLSVPSVAAVIAATNVAGLDGCRVTAPVGFWRDGSRAAPHNLYVDVPLLGKVAGGTGSYGALGKRQPWPPSTGAVDRISFVYPEEHPVVWRYDRAERDYLRWQDGAPHVDMAGRQIRASSVVVQFVTVRASSYYGEAGYRELTLTGEGDALLYAAGGKRAAIWRRDALGAKTHFFNPRGEETLLPPGRVFVQLVATGTQVEEAR